MTWRLKVKYWLREAWRVMSYKVPSTGWDLGIGINLRRTSGF